MTPDDLLGHADQVRRIREAVKAERPDLVITLDKLSAAAESLRWQANWMRRHSE